MSSLTDDEKVDVAKEKIRPLRKRKRVSGEKICAVCGDKALAHHFGTLACETCKAFFRRNATVKAPRICLFKGDCPVSIRTRRFCPACRLAKCFKVGMQAGLILDEEEKKKRMEKVKAKKCKKTCQRVSDEFDQSGSTQLNSPVCGVTTTGGQLTCSPEHTALVLDQTWLTASELSAGDITLMKKQASFSSEGLPCQVGENFDVILSTPGNLAGSQDSKMAEFPTIKAIGSNPLVEISNPSTPAVPASFVYCSETWQYATPTPLPVGVQSQDFSNDATASALLRVPFSVGTFQHVPRDALPSDPYMYWRLSEEERCLLTQLSSAYQDTLLSVLQGNPPREVISSCDISPEWYLHECEQEARNVITFSKRMQDFRQLRQDEQIALLKASTSQVLGIRSCALYIAERDAWLTHRGYFTVEQIKMLLPNHPFKESGVSFCRTIKAIVKNDVTLYALLHCVVLFDPCDERIIDRQLVNSIRDKYIILLRHYLESEYSYFHSERYLMALQENLIFYRNLCREGKPLIKKFFPSVPNKLLVELMDLE